MPLRLYWVFAIRFGNVGQFFELQYFAWGWGDRHSIWVPFNVATSAIARVFALLGCFLYQEQRGGGGTIDQG